MEEGDVCQFQGFIVANDNHRVWICLYLRFSYDEKLSIQPHEPPWASGINRWIYYLIYWRDCLQTKFLLEVIPAQLRCASISWVKMDSAAEAESWLDGHGWTSLEVCSPSSIFLSIEIEKTCSIELEKMCSIKLEKMCSLQMEHKLGFRKKFQCQRFEAHRNLEIWGLQFALGVSFGGKRNLLWISMTYLKGIVQLCRQALRRWPKILRSCYYLPRTSLQRYFSAEFPREFESFQQNSVRTFITVSHGGAVQQCYGIHYPWSTSPKIENLDFDSDTCWSVGFLEKTSRSNASLRIEIADFEDHTI